MKDTADIDRFPPLGRRPEATTITVRDLIGRVREGRLRVPAFQRPLRWTAEDNRRLVDSLWRGYPIGSLLLWKRPAPEARIRIAESPVDAPEVRDAWWVVDGQQRIMALAGSLLDLPNRGARWVLHFDAEQQAFKVGQPPLERVDIAIPLDAMGDLKRLGRWIREHDPSGEHVDRIEEAQQRLLDYSVPVYVVETDDEGPLRAGFARLNSTGARMRADEVFDALLGAPASGPSLDLGYLAAHCKQLGFGSPPRVEVMKAILAMSGQDPSRRVESLPEQDLGKLVTQNDAAAALSRTIAFLMNQCGIPRLRLVPYPVVFFILSRWFHIYPECEAETLNLLARWVWRGVATGAHERAAVSRMRHQVRAIRDDGPAAAIDRLLSHVETTRPLAPWVLHRFHHDNARSRVEMLALLAAAPEDRAGAVALDTLLDAHRIAREVFMPRDVAAEDKELARTAANRVLLENKDTNLQKELRSWEAGRHQSTLATQLIDAEAFAALANRDPGAFLKQRANTVCAAVDALLVERTGLNEPELRPRSHYIELEEEE